MSVPRVNTMILNFFSPRYIWLEVIKVHQNKEKNQKFQCDECEYKCLKKHRNHTEETDIKLKTEEM